MSNTRESKTQKANSDKSENTDVGSEENTPFQAINKYFEENHHLFSTLGVFGAVSIYLSTISNSIGYSGVLIDIGVISSLYMFIVVGVLADIKMASAFGLRLRDIFLLYPSDAPFMFFFFLLIYYYYLW